MPRVCCMSAGHPALALRPWAHSRLDPPTCPTGAPTGTSALRVKMAGPLERWALWVGLVGDMATAPGTGGPHENIHAGPGLLPSSKSGRTSRGLGRA